MRWLILILVGLTVLVLIFAPSVLPTVIRNVGGAGLVVRQSVGEAKDQIVNAYGDVLFGQTDDSIRRMEEAGAAESARKITPMLWATIWVLGFVVALVLFGVGFAVQHYWQSRRGF